MVGCCGKISGASHIKAGGLSMWMKTSEKPLFVMKKIFKKALKVHFHGGARALLLVFLEPAGFIAD
jgi:hypothetical protein